MPDHLNKNHRASLFWGGLRLSELTNETECAADIVCIDLEDSVPLDRKQDGRLALKQFLQTYKPTKSAQYMVRINSLDSEDGQSDLAMLVNQPAFMFCSCPSNTAKGIHKGVFGSIYYQY